MLEMTFVMFPFFSLFFLQLTLCYWLFAKVTLQQAVRAGVRYGITNTLDGCPGGGSDLTTCIKNKVQWAAGGLLTNEQRDLIEIKMCKPPNPGSNATCDYSVTGTAGANIGDNILTVSIKDYQILPLLPVIPDWSKPTQTNPLTFTVTCADKIEPGAPGGGAPPPAYPGP
jgi:hypothetical protein